MFTKKAFIFLNLFIVGCDVPGTIKIKNVSEGKAFYRYELINENDSANVHTIEIPKDKKRNEAYILFGFSQFWIDERIEEYLKSVRKIEIISPTDSIQLVDKAEMFEFFKKRRGGLFKNEIKIIIH